MADFITLGVGVDATRMQQGVGVANRALDSLSEKVTTAAGSTSRLQGNLDKTITASGSALSFASALTNIARGASEANIALVAMGSAVLLREGANVVKDFRELADSTKAVAVASKTATDAVTIYTGATVASAAATGTASAATSSLWAVIAANPIGAAIAAIGLLSAAFVFFGKSTVSATTDLDEFIKKARELEATGRVARTFGTEDVARAAAKQRQDQLFDAAVRIELEKKPVAATDLAGILGVRPSTVSSDIEQRFFPSQPGESELQRIARIQENAPNYVSGLQEAANRQQRTGANPFAGYAAFTAGEYTVAPDIAQDVLRQEYEAQAAQFAAEDKLKDEDKTQISNDLKAANAEMRELNSQAEQFGATMAQASLDFITGAKSAEDILKSIVLNFAGNQLQQGFSGLFNFGQQQAFGKTPPVPGAQQGTGFGNSAVPGQKVP